MDYSSPDVALTARNNADIARRLYRDAPPLPRFMMRWRPHICPFESLVSHVPAGARVLDIGCGGGLFLGLLAATRRGIRGFGTDYAASAIDVARRMAEAVRLEGSDATLDFRVVDGAAGLPQGPFDIVSLIDVAHHLPPGAVQSVLRTAASLVASDGGLLIYKDMADRPLWQASANRLHDLVIARQWISYVPIALVEKVLTECGLELIRAESFSRYWYRHELRVFQRRGAVASPPSFQDATGEYQ